MLGDELKSSSVLCVASSRALLLSAGPSGWQRYLHRHHQGALPHLRLSVSAAVRCSSVQAHQDGSVTCTDAARELYHTSALVFQVTGVVTALTGLCLAAFIMKRLHQRTKSKQWDLKSCTDDVNPLQVYRNTTDSPMLPSLTNNREMCRNISNKASRGHEDLNKHTTPVSLCQATPLAREQNAN
ncbi:hypothetical protein AAFF_G00229020 [Aldrovandia affinis]|uniref:Uncharacterized protein n=1 Tax=Aldrovandia affinis TaxID=143900 RepID=A0AAD7SVF9_9TELE|nr:hypothetical protein AAFF_G00229020 [Aldrovandia affinis]